VPGNRARDRIVLILAESCGVAVAIALSQTDEASLIRLDDAIGIACAAELKAAIVAALKAGREIRVSLDEVTDLDVTGFQVLWAAKREAKQAGVGFGLAGRVPEPVQGSLAAMGLNVMEIFK
jgi:anti-anti-sigma regulatory factor